MGADTALKTLQCFASLAVCFIISSKLGDFKVYIGYYFNAPSTPQVPQPAKNSDHTSQCSFKSRLQPSDTCEQMKAHSKQLNMCQKCRAVNCCSAARQAYAWKRATKIEENK
eukprot:scaffold535964_cov22-Prasinocladus_malaysianus.AAC.1